ncbi:hypothetical protein PF008_g9441 [Phytophthora fragariae]|uniref:Uncharacterized protein n=1 Tax=Phytophthora fragariae TaxID=53985 RepID=A0A6G0RWN9_9STRA|nr:hypothetical protein PF008_g9441 [Phytophthora fragariae]
MKRRGPCVHQQNLRAPASSTHQPPALRRNIAAAACLRLYAEGQELLQHKKLLHSRFGLDKVPTMAATTTTATATASSRDSEPPAASNSTRPQSSTASKSAVNQVSRSSTATTKRASVHSAGSKTTNSAASPSKERRSSVVYLPPGGRSPTIKHVFAKTYSLQSTMASRAAVAPRKKLSTARRPSSPTGGARRHHSPGRTATTKSPAAKPHRINATSTSLGPGTQRKQMTSRSTPSPDTARKGARANVATPRSAARRPSTAPVQALKTRTFSSIFQQQQAQEPVLVQVSRRTSSPIMSPVGLGGRRRPSVAPIGPITSPVRASGGSEAGSSVASPGSGSSPRASFIRRDNKLEKLQEQVNVLKASLGISEEGLQWKVESTKGNAFLAADRHLAACEERYDRLVFEMQELSKPARCADEDKANVALAAKLRSLEKQAQQVAELKTKATTYQADMVQMKKNLRAVRVDTELRRAKQDLSAVASAAHLELSTARRLESIKEELLSVQQLLKTEQGVLQTLLEWLGTETDRFGASVAAEDLVPSPVVSEQTLEAKRSLLYTLRTIPECTQGSERLATLCCQATQLASRITASRAHDLKRTETDLERTMRDVEIWKTRREQAKEFADEMRKLEAAWQARQREKNEECGALMRTYIPVDIADLSVEALIARAHEGGILYTYDLAAYLKTNRFLHWLVTHEDDIARANFLAIESAPFFMDFATYDIHELRALARVLPESFAFDKDCRKNAWRASFIEHVRQLAAQQQHETIKAGWDPAKRARRDVQLPELTARQQLNPIFCYPTDAEIDARLDKFERQRIRLEAKRARLKTLDEEHVPQAKAEYVAVAADARNEDLQRSFGKATLIALREEAKQQHLALCKERDAVKSDLSHGERAWSTMTPSYEQYQAEVAQIRALDPEIRNAARIRGPFPAEVDIQPRERAAFKKLSVEEEAEARKQELDNAIAKRTHDISEVAVVEASQTVSVGPETEDVESVTMDEAEVEALRLMQLEDKQMTDATESTATPELPIEAPRRGFQRVKSLQVAVGVLNFLEKDFCSPKRVMRGKEGGPLSPPQKPSESEMVEEVSITKDAQLVRTPRNSRSMPPTPRTKSITTKDEETKNSKPIAVVVPPKSKALLKLLEARKAQESNNSPQTEIPNTGTPRSSPFGGGKTNFLGELQNRFQRKTAKPDTETSSDHSQQPPTPMSTKKPLNFLDELKNASSRKVAIGDAGDNVQSKKPINFLDKRKSASARKSGASVEITECTEVSTPQTPKALVLNSTSATPRNFLDELKARAQPT